MKPIFPAKLQPGNEIRVIAPARSLAMISQETQDFANQRFAELGLKVTFGKHVLEADDFISSSIASRLADLHEAFRDPQVKAIFTVIGGFNANQLLDGIDWALIKANPKIICGYSDITILQNAIFAKTGLVTYSGPHYSSFGDQKSFDYTLKYLKKCLFSDQEFTVLPSEAWSDDAWYFDQNQREFIPNPGFLAMQKGRAQGTLIGGNLCTFNLLQGTPYFPSLKNAILFLEDDYESQPVHFDRNLQSLIHLPEFKEVKGLVIGRFQKGSQFSDQLLKQIIESKVALRALPVLAGVDFGHTTPLLTFPVGGEVSLEVGEKVSLKIGKR